MSTRNFAEILESRLLLSASAASTALSAAVQTDRLAIRVDLLEFRADCLLTTSAMLSDTAAIKANDPQQAATLTPLVKQLRSDVTGMRRALLADRLAEAENVLTDELVIVGDKRQALIDHGDASAEATDHAKLVADRIKLQDDMIAGLDARIATRQADYNTIFADGQAIAAAVKTDPQASAKLQADVAKWLDDGSSRMNTLLGDLQKLAADRTQLVIDLTAMQYT